MKTRFSLNDQLATVGLDFKIDSVSGINNAGEILALAFDGEKSRPYLLRPVSDTDGDGAPDAWEIRYSFDPFDASDGELDPDRDGLSNSEEHRHRTDPLKSDSDDDTMKDGWEVAWGLDPLEAADAYSDPDEDLVQNRFEHALGTAPTGIYRLEEKEIGGVDPNASFQLVMTHVGQEASFSVVTATIDGDHGTYLVGHDPGDSAVMIPSLAPGKRVFVRTIGRTGTIYGVATDADNKNRCFCYRKGDPELTVFDIPSHPDNPYTNLYDVSSDERSILVSRRTPGNTYTTDIFSPVLGEEYLYHFREELPADAKNGSHTLTVTSGSVQESGTSGAFNYYFSPTVCENSLFALGVQQNYHYMSGESDEVIVRRQAPETFEEFVDLGREVLVEGSRANYANGYLRRTKSGGFYYSWNANFDSGSSVDRQFFIDPEEGKAQLLKTPSSSRSYVVDGNRNGNAIVTFRHEPYLSNSSYSLKCNTLRVRDSFNHSTPAIELPRVSELVDGGLQNARTIDSNLAVRGFHKTGDAIRLWTLAKANDFDGDGVDDDFEKLKAELGSGYLAAQNPDGSKPPEIDPDFLDAFARGTWQQNETNSILQASDRDGDGIEDHEDAHPDEKLIDWKKGKRPTFAVVEIGSELDRLATPEKIDFSMDGTVVLTEQREVESTEKETGEEGPNVTDEEKPKVNHVTVFYEGKNDTTLEISGGELVPQGAVDLLNPDNEGYHKRKYENQKTTLDRALIWKYGKGEGLFKKRSFATNESFPGGAAKNPEASLPFLLAHDEGGENDGSRSNARVFASNLNWSEISIRGTDHDNLLAAARSLHFNKREGESVRDQVGDPEMLNGIALDETYTRARAIVASSSNNWVQLQAPRPHFFKSNFPPGVVSRDLEGYEISLGNSISVGSLLSSNDSTLAERWVATSYYPDNLPFNYAKGFLWVPQVHVLYDVTAVGVSEDGKESELIRHSPRDLVPEYAPRFDHQNMVGVSRVVVGDGARRTRNLWVAGSTLHVSRTTGEFHKTGVDFYNVGPVRGISTQGWIATGRDGGTPPSLMYASEEGEIWTSLNSLIRNRTSGAGSEKEYSVVEIHELERNGLILATVEVDGGNDRLYDSLAILVPIESDTQDSTKHHAALETIVPDRYRSITLDGRPAHENAPQGEAEEDLPEERGHIDVYTRQLKYDTSHAFLTVPASDLALQVTQVLSPTPIPVPPLTAGQASEAMTPDGKIDFLKQARFREATMEPHVGPFGANWSTNLCATAEVQPVFRTDPATDQRRLERFTVQVTDEAGRSYSFTSSGPSFKSFSLTPSKFSDAKAYQINLTRETPAANGDPSRLVLHKKFGTKLFFDWVGPVPAQVFSDGLDSEFGPAAGGFRARLARVEDRYHREGGPSRPSAIIYHYSDTKGLEFHPHRIDVEGREALNLKIHTRLIASAPGHHKFPLIQAITDSRGFNTTFTYEWKSAGGARIPVLHTVRKADGGITTYQYHKPRVSAPVASKQAVALDLEDTLLDGFDDLSHTGVFQKDKEKFEIKVDDKKLLEAKCHINLASITNAVGETYAFEYEPDSRFESVTATFKPTVQPSESVGSHRLAIEPVVKSLMEEMKAGLKVQVRENYEEHYRNSGGILIHSSEKDGQTELTFALPKVGGTDEISKVILPSPPGGDPVEVLIERSHPLEIRGNEDRDTVWKTLASQPDFPIQVFPGTNREEELYHTEVTDAEGSITRYRFTDAIYGVLPSSSVEGFIQKNEFGDEQVIHPTSVAFKTIVITNHLGQSIQYELDPLAGFALKKSTDLNGHEVIYEYDDFLSLGRSPGTYGSDFVSVQPPKDRPDEPASLEKIGVAVRYSDPTRETHRQLLETGDYEVVKSTRFSYSPHFRIMKEIVDPNGNTTVWDVAGNGTRTAERVYHGSAGNDAVPLKETIFRYSNSFPGFLRHTISKIGPDPQPWEQELVTLNFPDPFGRNEYQESNPFGDEIATESTFDLAGNKTSSTDGRGNTTEFVYDSVGRLITTRFPGPDDATKEIFYDKASRIIKTVDENGIKTFFRYDHRGRRISTARDLNGNHQIDFGDIVTRKNFNNVNNVTSLTDPNSNTAKTEYDSLHRPVIVTDALGNSVEMFYGSEDGSDPGSGLLNGSGYSPLRTKDARGYLTEIKQDSLYRTVETRAEFTLPEDSSEWHSRILGPHLHTKVIYDSNGNVRSSIAYRAANGGSSQGVLETKTKYDALNRSIRVTTADGTNLASSVRTFYTRTGLAWRSVAYEGLAGLERITETEFDGHGRPTKIWSPDPETGRVVKDLNQGPLHGSPCITNRYDNNGNVTATIDPLGNRTDFYFDERNRQFKVENPLVYDATTGAEIRPTATMEYDAVGNLISSIDPRGIKSITEFDAANRAILSISAAGHPEQIQTSSEYDANGNAISVTDPNGHITVNHYDALSRLIATVVNPETGNPSRNLHALEPDDILVGNQYDSAGNLLRVADGMAAKNWSSSLWSGAHVTGFTFDGLGRQTTRVWDIGTIAEKVDETFYDALLATHAIDPKGQKKTFLYDALHRLDQVLHPANSASGGKTGSSSSPADNLKYHYQNKIGGSGSGPGPLISVKYPGQSSSQPGGSTAANVSYNLDYLGRQLSETSAGVTHTHIYDRNGNRRMTSNNASDRKLISFYDSHNRLTKCLETSRSVSDPLDEIGGPGVRTTVYHYNANGSVVEKNVAQLIETRHEYDALGRTMRSETRDRFVSDLISGFDYSLPVPGSGDVSGYDAAGNLRHVVEFYSDLTSRTIQNNYDATNRLCLESETKEGIVKDTFYEYDKANNRTAKIIDDASPESDGPSKVTYWYGDPTSSSSQNSNQLIQYSIPLDPEVVEFAWNQKTQIGYDANGNRSWKSDPSESDNWIYHGYDRSNRLIHVSDYFDLNETYRYDYRTRRIARREASNGQSVVTFNGGTSAAEWHDGAAPDTASNRITTPSLEYIRGSDWGGGVGGILYTIPESGIISLNSYNSRGDVVARVSETGSENSGETEVTWQGAYEAFGTRVEEHGETDLRQMANTKEEDPTGLLNEGFRYRDLETGVWLTRDPAGFVDGPNVYTYVVQNPWSSFDPLGLSWVSTDTSDAAVRKDDDDSYSVMFPVLTNVEETTGSFFTGDRVSKTVTKKTGDYRVWSNLSGDQIANLTQKDLLRMARFMANGHEGFEKAEKLEGYAETLKSIPGLSIGAKWADGDKEGALKDAAWEIGTVLGVGVAVKGFKALKAARAASKPPANRVLWSGGDDALEAANKFARANGSTTLEMTPTGKVLTKLTDLTSVKAVLPLWEMASKRFAKGASGKVDVFFKSGAEGAKGYSVLQRKELPQIIKKKLPIKYHTVY